MVDMKPKGKQELPLGALREDEIMDLVETVLEEDNPFHVPPELIPEGYAVEYKVQTVMGQRMPNQNSLDSLHQRTRWEPVSLSTHPQFRKLTPPGYDKDTVEQGGQILMIRPKAISDKVKQIQEMKARSQLNDKLTQVGNAGPGEAPRKVIEGVRRSYEPVQVPE